MEPGINALMSSATRQQIYRIYLNYLEIAETKRRWIIFNDVPWESCSSQRRQTT
jgi:hypothetical protein